MQLMWLQALLIAEMSTSPVSTALLAALSKAFVVLPIALTTTTGLPGSASRKEFTAAPCGASHRMHRTCRTIPAHWRTCSPPPTEVPPNFMISNCCGPALAAQKMDGNQVTPGIPLLSFKARSSQAQLVPDLPTWGVWQTICHEGVKLGVSKKNWRCATHSPIPSKQKKRLLPIADSNLIFSIFSQILHILTSQGQEWPRNQGTASELQPNIFIFACKLCLFVCNVVYTIYIASHICMYMHTDLFISLVS